MSLHIFTNGSVSFVMNWNFSFFHIACLLHIFFWLIIAKDKECKETNTNYSLKKISWLSSTGERDTNFLFKSHRQKRREKNGNWQQQQTKNLIPKSNRTQTINQITNDEWERNEKRKARNENDKKQHQKITLEKSVFEYVCVCMFSNHFTLYF